MFQANVRRGPASDVPPEATGVGQPAAGAGHRTHWARPDIAGDLLAAARDPRAAPPREIRVRPELYERLLAGLAPADRVAVVERAVLGAPDGVPLVVDPELPGCPGFEVVRVLPTAPARPPAPARPSRPAWPAGGSSHAAAA